MHVNQVQLMMEWPNPPHACLGQIEEHDGDITLLPTRRNEYWWKFSEELYSYMIGNCGSVLKEDTLQPDAADDGMAASTIHPCTERRSLRVLRRRRRHDHTSAHS
jgi:hypothetical protein